MSVKVLRVINRDRCIGCYSCMYACTRQLRGLGGTSKSAMRVRAYSGVEGTFSIRVCARCEEPDCAEACPTGALKTAPGGGVLLNREKCIHCGACVKTCAITALQWDEEEKIPIPCIHCGQCVRYCPNGVLALTDRQGPKEGDGHAK
ncbi:MAG: 4Fe-4S binding protein [Thermovirgaceae bacterium]|nr:4Fe-4S binding protein [Thermovirgaceae bacterium]